MKFRSIGNFGNYLLVNFNEKHNKDFICKELKKNKIYVKNFNDNILQNFILITVGPINNMKKFIKILKKINKNND